MSNLHPFRNPHSELHGYRYALAPHDDNNDIRKAITLMLVASWCLVFVGVAYGAAVPTEMFGLLSVFVGIWVTKVQEREMNRLFGDSDERAQEQETQQTEDSN